MLSPLRHIVDTCQLTRINWLLYPNRKARQLLALAPPRQRRIVGKSPRLVTDPNISDVVLAYSMIPVFFFWLLSNI